MNKEELKVFLANQFPELVFDETQKILFVQVDVLQFKTLMQELRSNADLNFDFLTGHAQDECKSTETNEKFKCERGALNG
jgi:hypothetical protein